LTKYVFITGGVLSGLGKGVVTASTGLLLKSMGYNVTAIKIDPYVNVDAGTMNPYMHGEVFVTEDGGETDLDLGHYERFLNVELSRRHNITTGQIYSSVIERERRGDYLGRCVQVIPHVTDEIKLRIRNVAKESQADIAVVEIGGTVGDIEGLPFLEAVRQMRIEEGPSSTFFVHVALAPIIQTGEQKTKPVQHSVNELRRIGIQPDAVIVRSPRPLEDEARSKIALYSNLPERAVFSDPDTDITYRVPLILRGEGYANYLVTRLGLDFREPDLSEWEDFVDRLTSQVRGVRIAMIGKYTKLHDSYISIVEALKHASAWEGVKPILKWFEATDIERGTVSPEEIVESSEAAVILPGFGRRGSEGKIRAIKAFRESGKPVLGICFGMQLMVVEAARNLLGLNNANSRELDPHTPHPVVDLLPSQYSVKHLGGTMRLGSYPIKIVRGTRAWEMYGRDVIRERHRHRYEVNPKYVDALESVGFRISGWSPENYVEFIEMENYPTLYFGSQPHPEFRSRPLQPSPIYNYFIKAVNKAHHN